MLKATVCIQGVGAGPLRATQRYVPCKSFRSHVASLRRTNRRFSNVATTRATSEVGTETYMGVYGPWQITQQDLIEIWTYRICISIVAGSFAVGTALLQLNSEAANTSLETGLAALGAAGLGVALVQIHIYVTPLKRMLQLFLLAGALGGGYLLFSTEAASSSLPAYVALNPSSVWFVGPAFAALTGLTFKEGVCYGKAEAFALTLLIPALLLLHLAGLGGAQGEIDKVLADIVTVLLLVFASRKYTQPVKDDIGDGSVFKFQKLAPEEQEALVRQLQSAGGGRIVQEDDEWDE